MQPFQHRIDSFFFHRLVENSFELSTKGCSLISVLFLSYKKLLSEIPNEVIVIEVEVDIKCPYVQDKSLNSGKTIDNPNNYASHLSNGQDIHYQSLI